MSERYLYLVEATLEGCKKPAIGFFARRKDAVRMADGGEDAKIWRLELYLWKSDKFMTLQTFKDRAERINKHGDKIL